MRRITIICAGTLALYSCSDPRLRPTPTPDAGVLPADSGTSSGKDASSMDATPPADAGDAGTTDATANDTGVLGCDEGNVELELIGTSFDGAAVIDEQRDLVIGLPRHLDHQLRNLSAVSLADGAEENVALTVDAPIPLVQVLAASYDRTAGRSVILAYPQTRPGDGSIGERLELLTLTVDANHQARIRRLTPTNPPEVEGFLFTWIYPEGDGTHYRAFRFDQASVRGAVSGETVTWETEVTLSTDGFFDSNQITYDPTTGRLFAFGELTFEGDPMNPTERFLPSVFELTLSGGTHWSSVPSFGDAPPESVGEFGLFASYALFYDDVDGRLVVLMDHETEDPFGGEEPYFVTGAWSWSNGSWTVIQEDLGFCCAPYNGGVSDHARQRALDLRGGSSNGIDFAPGREGDSVQLGIGVAPAPRTDSVVFDSTRGAIVAGTHEGPAMMSVRSGDFAWRPLLDTPVTRPFEAMENYAITVDGDLVLTIGGGNNSGTQSTGAVYAIDTTQMAPAWTEVVTTGPAHDGHVYAAVAHDAAARTVYLAGGWSAGPVDSRRVSALDLSTMTWRTVADLPVARRYASARLLDADTLDVLFGVDPANPTAVVPNGFRVDIPSGQVTPLAPSGDLPMMEPGGVVSIPFAAGLAVVAPRADGVDVFQEVDLVFTKQEVCRDPRTLWSRRAVVDPMSDTGYLIGVNTWRVTR